MAVVGEETVGQAGADGRCVPAIGFAVGPTNGMEATVRKETTHQGRGQTSHIARSAPRHNSGTSAYQEGPFQKTRRRGATSMRSGRATKGTAFSLPTCISSGGFLTWTRTHQACEERLTSTVLPTPQSRTGRLECESEPQVFSREHS